MKKVFAIIIAIFLALNAQTSKQVKQRLNAAGVNPEQAKQMAKDLGITDRQVESAKQTSDIDLDNQVGEETPSKTTLEVIEIDGVKYIKDGLRYIPVLSEKYEVMEEQKGLETVTDVQEDISMTKGGCGLC